ncbi:MAG: hypothetical protein FJX72_04875 [Armatimonadetes bacterium]|nr:hypothetical protein [Armatimonadota bacterium]
MVRCVWLGSVLLLVGARGYGQALRSSALEVSVARGSVAGLVNRATGERYVAAISGGAGSATMHRIGAQGAWVAQATAVERPAAGIVAHRMRREQDRLTTRFTARKDGAVEVRQEGAGTQPGIYGASWSLGIVPDRFEVLVPGNSGQRFGKDAPYETRTFEYPLGWEAAFTLIQGPKGGVLIHAEDPQMLPKVMTVERVRGGFALRFESRCEAPFEPLKRVTGKPWVMRAYKGPWQVGAAMYRAWAAKAYGLRPLASRSVSGGTGRTPAWAAGIQFVAIVEMNIETIRLLARRVIPSRTLLYVPNWRRDGYDRNYPDYTALPEFGPFVTAAHRLGYRVMPHVNYFGCDPKNPEYERFRRYHMRDPFTKELLWWDWTLAEPPIKFAYINPASREWRALFVERMKTFCRQYDIDALHLDQTLCIFNDANGRVDGMSCAEGNLALHREMKQALPQVALSGEGLNEVTCRYEEFAQRHVWGIDHVEGSWNDRQLDMAHPISSSALLPYTTIYGYLGLPNPVGAPDLHMAWKRAYERFGVIPTYAWPTPDQLGPNPPAAIERLLRRGGLFMRYGLTPDLRPNWAPNDLFLWRTEHGGRVRYVRERSPVSEPRAAGERSATREGVVALELRPPGSDSIVIERRIEGRETLSGPGAIAGWPAYDEKAILGLHPGRRYDWTPDPRDLKRMRLSAVPKGWHVSRSGDHADLFRIGLAAHGSAAESDIRLWEHGDGARVGVVGLDGRTVTRPGLSFMDDASGGGVRPDGEGLFMHPPYRARAGARAPVQSDAQRVAVASRDALPSEPRPTSFVEYRLSLPDVPAIRFEANAHLRRGADTSDGVRFRVAAWPAREPNRRLTAEVHALPDSAKPMILDLSAMRGQNVVLRLEADAGPKGDPTFDWGRLEKPRIAADPTPTRPVPATLRFAGERPIGRILAGSGVPVVTPQPGGGALVYAELPNVFTLPFGEPLAVDDGAELKLTGLPLVVRARSEDGLEGPPPQYGPSIGPASCGGVERNAIGEHPPTRGCTLLDYHLRLPTTPMRLHTAIGIRDGSKSNGVGFRVEVNGRELFSRDLKPGTGWHPIEVDLEPYANRDIIVTLVTDALGEFNFDWAVWAEPTLEAVRTPVR